MRRFIPLALVAPALTVGTLVAAAPAYAACEPAPLRTSLRAADLVVTGEVTAVEKLADRQVYTVKVKRVYAGSSPAMLELQAPAADRPCALPVKKDQQWLFLSQSDPKKLVVRSDWGSAPLSAAVATDVADVLGSGTLPTAGGSTPPTDVTLTRVEQSTTYGFWQLAFPGGVLAAGGLLMLLLARALSGGRRP